MTDHPTIGASQIAILMGCHVSGRTKHDLWREMVHGEKQEQNEAMKRGLELEPAIAVLYANAKGYLKGVRYLKSKIQPQDPYLHVQRPYPAEQIIFNGGCIHATPDSIHHDGLQSLLAEFKTTNSREGWGDPGTNQVPSGYLMQVQAQMLCTGIKQADLAVLFKQNTDFAIYHIKESPELQAELQAKAKEFIETYVIPKIMPPVDASEACRQNILDQFPEAKGEYRTLADDHPFLARLARLRDMTAIMREAEKECELIKNEARLEIGEAEGLQTKLGRLDYKSPKPIEKIDYELVCDDLRCMLPPEWSGLVDRQEQLNTSFKTNPRRLMPYWKKG